MEYVVRLDLPTEVDFTDSDSRNLEVDLCATIQEFLARWIYTQGKITQDARATIQKEVFVSTVLAQRKEMYSIYHWDDSLDKDFKPNTVTCINCHKEFDERDVFVTMGIIYCPEDVVYVLRNRLYRGQITKVITILAGAELTALQEPMTNEDVYHAVTGD